MAIKYHEIDYDDGSPLEDQYITRLPDNCICYIPMHNKNDLTDLANIHHFTVDFKRPISFLEDVWDLKQYIDAMVYDKDYGSTTAIQKTATSLWKKCTGQVKADTGTIPYMHIDNAYSDNIGGVCVPSRHVYAKGITSYTAVKDSLYYYGSSDVKYNVTDHYVHLNPCPYNVNNPKTGVKYNKLTMKMDFFYHNGHWLFMNTYFNRVTDISSSNATDRNNYIAAYQISEKMNLEVNLVTNSSGSWGHVLYTDATKSVTMDGGYWYTLTFTKDFSDEKNQWYYAYWNKNNVAGLNTSAGVKSTKTGTGSSYTVSPNTAQNSYDYFHLCVPKSNAGGISLSKNAIRDFYIYDSDEYDQEVAVKEKKKFYSYQHDNVSHRIITNDNEQKYKYRRCYEYR